MTNKEYKDMIKKIEEYIELLELTMRVAINRNEKIPCGYNLLEKGILHLKFSLIFMKEYDMNFNM